MKYKYVIPLLLAMPIHSNQFHSYFWANFKGFEDKDVANKWYESIFSKPHSLLTNKGYIHLLNDQHNYQKIISLMPKVEVAFKNDPDMQLIFVNALRKAGKKDEADDRLIKLSQQFKTHPEIVFNTAEALIQRKELKNAIALIDSFLNNAPRRPNNFLFYFRKAQIYMHMKDFKLARAELQNCLDAHPQFSQAFLLKAMIEEEAGQLDQAIKGYSSFLELSGPNQQIEQHLLGLVMRQKASQQNKRIIVVNRSCLEKAVMLFEKKDYQGALSQVNTCLSQNEQDTQARLLKVQILSALKEHTELIKMVLAWVIHNPQELIWLQTLHLLPRIGIPIEKVINTFTVLYSHFPKHEAVPLYLADLHTRAGNIEKAIFFHQRSLDQIKNNKIRSRVLFQIASLQYDRGQYEDMLATINTLEKEDNAFAPAYNLHAYYCATHTNHLADAEHLFKKAYDLDKGNPHFLDTKAVILYKQKKYAQALKLLQPLSEKMQHDSTIFIHLAKTYDKMGNVEKARTAIDHAQLHAHTPYEKQTAAMLSYKWGKRAA